MITVFHLHLALICLAFGMGGKFIGISFIIGREEEKADGFDCLEFYEKGKLKFQLRGWDFFNIGFLCVILGIVDLIHYLKMLDAI